MNNSYDTIKYLHYRPFDEDGNIMPKGGCTVAYVHGPEGITYASARCHDSDRYQKHLGRVKSSGRLLSPHYAHTSNLTSHEFVLYTDKINAQFYLFRKGNV